MTRKINLRKLGALIIIPFISLIFSKLVLAAEKYNPGPIWPSLQRSLSNNPIIPGIMYYALGIDVGAGTMTDALIPFIIFIFIFVAFGDIIQNFSAFSRPVAWVLSFCIAAIANISGLTRFIAVSLIGWVAIFGAYGIILVIASSIVAFILIHLGVGELTKWVLVRQAHITAAKQIAKGEEIGGTITAIGKIGTHLKKLH